MFFSGRRTLLQENTSLVEIHDIITTSNELTFDEALARFDGLFFFYDGHKISQLALVG